MLCYLFDILIYAVFISWYRSLNAFHISFILGFMWCVPEGGLSTHPTATDPEKQTFLAFQTLLGLFKTQCHNKVQIYVRHGPKDKMHFVWLKQNSFFGTHILHSSRPKTNSVSTFQLSLKRSSASPSAATKPKIQTFFIQKFCKH